MNEQTLDSQLLRKWIYAFALIKFDVDEGQKVQFIVPEVQLSQQSMKQLAMLSFPDSNSFNDYQNSCKFTFRMYNGIFGYSCFKQKKDPFNLRGFSQKSFVILSELPFVHLFEKLAQFIVFKTFNNAGDEEFPSIMNRICLQMSKWPQPSPKKKYCLPILDYQLQLQIPNYLYSKERSFTTFSKGIEEDKIKLKLLQTSKELNLKNILKQQQQLREGPFQQIKLTDTFLNCYEALWLIWEKVILNKSILLIGTNPQQISHAVLGSVSLIYPFAYNGNYNPYVTVYDPHLNRIASEDRNWVLGGTNPLFSKFFNKQITEIITLDKSFKCPKHLKPLKELIIKSTTQEQQAINESAIRKYFYQLSRSVMMILDNYLQQQTNDLKIFSQANFLKQLKDRKDHYDLDSLFSSRKHIYQFMKEFLASSNFQLFLLSRNTIKVKPK